MAAQGPSLSPNANGAHLASLNTAVQALSASTSQALDLVDKLPTSALAGLVMPKPISTAYDLYRTGTALYNAAANPNPQSQKAATANLTESALEFAFKGAAQAIKEEMSPERQRQKEEEEKRKKAEEEAEAARKAKEEEERTRRDRERREFLDPTERALDPQRRFNPEEELARSQNGRVLSAYHRQQENPDRNHDIGNHYISLKDRQSQPGGIDPDEREKLVTAQVRPLDPQDRQVLEELEKDERDQRRRIRGALA